MMGSHTYNVPIRVFMLVAVSKKRFVDVQNIGTSVIYRIHDGRHFTTDECFRLEVAPLLLLLLLLLLTGRYVDRICRQL